MVHTGGCTLYLLCRYIVHTYVHEDDVLISGQTAQLDGLELDKVQRRGDLVDGCQQSLIYSGRFNTAIKWQLIFCLIDFYPLLMDF